MSKEVMSIPKGSFNIPDNSAGLMTGSKEVLTDESLIDLTDGDRDLSPEEMELAAELELQKKNKLKQTASGNEGDEDDKDEVTQEKLEELTAKAQNSPDKLTKDEIKILVDNDIIEDPGTDGKDSKEQQEINAKLAELAKKKPEELTDEEKTFIEENTPEVSLIAEMKKDFGAAYGIELKEEYSDDIEGSKKLIDHVAKVRAEKILDETIRKNKQLAALHQHFVVEQRGLETFLAGNIEPDFKRLEIKQIVDTNTKEQNEAIEASQKRILETYYKAKGNSEDEYKLLIQQFADTGKLFDKATEAKKALVKDYDTRLKAAKDAEKAEIEAAEQEITNQWNTVRETLNKNDFEGFSIPKSDLAPFMDAVLTQGENGYTKMDVIRKQKMTLQRQLLIDYMLFKDMKVPGLEAKAKPNGISLKFKNGKAQNSGRKIPLKGAQNTGGITEGDRTILRSVIMKNKSLNQ